MRRRSPEARSRGSVNIEPGGKLIGGVATAAIMHGTRAGSFVAPMMLAGRPGASFVAAAPTPVQTNPGMTNPGVTQVQMGNAQVMGATMAPLVQLHASPHMHCR